jgi:dihydroxyacid dehydratase/phosphogluconate dehydratase
MDATTKIASRLPSRQETEGLQRSGMALHLNDAALHLSDATEIFKKTLYVPGLKPAGRDVAKDMREFASIPLLMKPLLDHGTHHGACFTVAGEVVVENLKAVKRNSHLNDASDLLEGAISTIDAGTGILNVKLTDKELFVRPTKRTTRATNHTAGALWKYARQVGPAANGAAIHAGGAHEKYYADV